MPEPSECSLVVGKKSVNRWKKISRGFVNTGIKLDTWMMQPISDDAGGKGYAQTWNSTGTRAGCPLC